MRRLQGAAPPGLGLACICRWSQESRARTWKEGGWKREGERGRASGCIQVTGAPAAPASTHPVSISFLPGRLEMSRAVVCPGVWGSWNLSPALSCEDFTISCSDWESVIPGIFYVLDSTASTPQTPPVNSPRAPGRGCHWTALRA